MEEQKGLSYFLNWFITKPMYRIISVPEFDLLMKVKGVDLIQGLDLLLHSVRSHKTKTNF